MFLRERWPHLAAWDNKFFKLPAYEAFASDFKMACARPEVVNPSLSRTDSETRAYVDSQFKNMQDSFIEMKHFMTNELASWEDSKSVLETQHKLAGMISSGLTWRIPFSEALPPNNAGTSSSVVTASAVQVDFGPGTISAPASSSAPVAGEIFPFLGNTQYYTSLMSFTVSFQVSAARDGRAHGKQIHIIRLSSSLIRSHFGEIRPFEARSCLLERDHAFRCKIMPSRARSCFLE